MNAAQLAASLALVGAQSAEVALNGEDGVAPSLCVHRRWCAADFCEAEELPSRLRPEFRLGRRVGPGF